MTSLRSTTAILVAFSLIQPLPSLAQSRPGAGLNDTDKQAPASERNRQDARQPAAVICAEAGITDDQACRLFLQELEADDPPDARSGTAPGQPADPGARGRERAEEAAAEAEVRAAAEAAAAEAAAARAEEAAQAAARAAAEDAAAAEARARAAVLAVEAAAATLAGSDPDSAEPAEVISETVTEQTRRSSSEEFRDWRRPREATRSVPGQAPAATPRSPSGLSDLERAGLFALGAVVVGAILANGRRVEAQTGDRVVLLDDDGVYTVLKDDDALLRTPGSEVRTERFADGSTRTVVIREDGTTIITVRDVNGRALRRVRVEPDGREYLLIDDTRTFAPVILRDLPPPIRTATDFRPGTDYQPGTDREALRLALLAADRRDLGRSFSLRQVREIVEVRELAPEINLDGITFETNSAAIRPEQAERLREMGLLMREFIRDNPSELFLVEGHTDAVGDAGYNLLLSDRRAESVALAFSEYFGVGPENIIVQGYGERFLKIPTQSAEQLNRRVAVRRITALLRPY
ncbi:MAG: OmpA family protein [Pararhodobacter sp.]|nr:OmpA family protein [Pararhodobacter sp.]